MREKTVLKKNNKAIPLKITKEMKLEIQHFKDSLIELRDDFDTSEYDTKSIDIILNKLDDYDRNFIIAYYSVANCSTKKAAQLFNTTMPVIAAKRKMIINKIKELNDTYRTNDNKPVVDSCN